jgi:uncharacterized protein
VARVVHFEIPVDDPERAKRFYGAVFDWELAGYGEVPYWLATTGDAGGPGIDGALIGRSHVHAAPVVIVGVADLAATVARATDNGAEVITPRQSIPGVGWSAYLRDPEGNVVGVFQDDPDAA